MSEAFKHQGRFITGLRYQVQQFQFGWEPGQRVAMKGNGLAFDAAEQNEAEAHMAKIWPCLRAGNERGYLNIFPMVTGYSLVDGRSCEALGADLKCTLQNDKPAMCRTVPFDPILPETLQGAVLPRFTRYGCVWPADDGVASDDLIYRDRAIVHDQMKADFNERGTALVATAREVEPLAMFMSAGADFAPATADVFMASARGGWCETSMAPLLLASAMVHPEKREEYRAFARSQIALINEEIGLAMKRKDKRDRERTGTLRNYVPQYENVLTAFDDPDFEARSLPAMRNVSALDSSDEPQSA
ncbi:hypothetical protein [Geopseudomonas aromaticivorans]